MSENNPFRNVTIAPSYAMGFNFSWEIHPDFYADGDYVFRVEEAENAGGPWKEISPELINLYMWAEEGPRVAPKDPVQEFRIHLCADDKDYYSYHITPYGDLPRREYLIVRDIMRIELLQQRKMSGVLCKLWRKSVFGPKCTHCTDFVTDDPTDIRCQYCYGTGRQPGYHGPYDLWVTFNPENRDKQMENDNTGVKEPYVHTGRIVGTVKLKKDDIIVDPKSDRRYFVWDVQHLTEIRRYPVVQQAKLGQIAVTHPVYRLWSQNA